MLPILLVVGLSTVSVDAEQVQENIAYARALNSEVTPSFLSITPVVSLILSCQHQLELLNSLAASFQTNQYRLLIIDSIMACFRVDFCGRGELADRQQKLNQFLSRLTHMAEEFNVCVLMVSSDYSPSSQSAKEVCLPSRTLIIP